jgi:hypothetical protein
MATESPRCNTPVSVAGGNPVTESAGQIPTSPVTMLGPMLLTTGVAPRIPKLQAAPNAKAPEGGAHGTVVVNVQTLLAAKALPNVSFAPVVTVAVNRVFAARLAEGVKVATLVDELYVTCPETFVVPGPVNVKVVVVIVAGFIALLNVAVMRTVLGQTRVEASSGVTEVTVGGVKGSVGPPAPAFLSGSLQLASTMTNKNSGIQILQAFNLDISFSPSEIDKRELFSISAHFQLNSGRSGD